MMASAGGESSGGHDRWEASERGSLSRGIIFFGLIGAIASTVAAARLRRTVDWVYNQLRLRSNSSWWDENTNFFRGNYSEQAQKRYNTRMQEEYEEEMERLERIRRMQSVFNRERSKIKKTYESWQNQGGPGAYQHSPRNDWYWEEDISFKESKPNFRAAPRGPRPSGHYIWSHHYAVLGLDRSRANPYSDLEIKTAFRAKAMECHPDQNQENKEAAEEKFKEVLKSYEAIKSERRNERY
ncbi:uncharacterized protein LOC110017917 [Phalaenopsis equestris]|uniref:uncharacterized protein LOC110017917 n=1 Tax=Phalaenopsis equestris TaxID=78828 RepID=UPI0009E27757|nr:uncharacterized protein LOC110017917 [Phalaenopsis equestris]